MTGHHGGQVLAYMRVSSTSQSEARQVAAIGAVDKVFLDKASGKNTERPALQELRSYARAGDVIRCLSPDRLARSTVDLLTLVTDFKEKGVDVEFVDFPGLNTNSPHGEFTLALLGAVAQLERAEISSRQMAGIHAARERGVYDRAPKLTPSQVSEARIRIKEHGVPHARVARELSVSRQTLYTALKGQGKYATL